MFAWNGSKMTFISDWPVKENFAGIFYGIICVKTAKFMTR